MKKISLTLLVLFVLPLAHAKRFANQYTEFELPAGWECALEGTEWVCQSQNKDRQKEAIIILAAKIRGSQDSLDQYQAYLKDTKTFNLPGGKTQVSEPKYTKLTMVNGHRWVDALHLASEVPGFYTRYLATVKEDLGVAVTFSVSKDHYASYQPIFDKIVDSMRVFRQAQGDVAQFKLKGKDANLLDNTTFIPGEGNRPDIAAQKKRRGSAGSGESGDMLLYLILGAAVAGFIIVRKKKGKNKKG